LAPEGRIAVWIHAVSVGEVVAITGLVGLLRKRLAGKRVVVSTTTATGQKLARRQFGAENVFYFPVDLRFAVKPYFRALQPEMVVLAETEFWPNFLRTARENSAAVAVVNARISDRSVKGYRRLRRFFGRVLRNVDLFLSQTETDAERLIEIGAPAEKVEVKGNLKFDVVLPPPPAIVSSLRSALKEGDAGPVIVAGSTVDGEEALLFRAFENILASYPYAALLLAPRHPERFEEVAKLLEQLGIQFWRRSSWRGEALAAGVMLLDSIGELAALYALADVAFVGGSLVPRGGHNIIEPAQHGVPIVVGNHTENFRDIVGLFESRNAVRIVGTAELPITLMELIANPQEREELGRRALETIRSQTGAAERTAMALTALLEHKPDCSPISQQGMRR
jgi:3-deoxy-D-manno-octulosonic-acid transferase